MIMPQQQSFYAKKNTVSC